MLKITVIDFIRHNPWGGTDLATHYYANGKRISKNSYYRNYSSFILEENGFEYDATKTKTVVKDGITRNYTEIFYKENQT